jgi:hypothetical protein
LCERQTEFAIHAATVSPVVDLIGLHLHGDTFRRCSAQSAAALSRSSAANRLCWLRESDLCASTCASYPAAPEEVAAPRIAAVS